MPNAWVKGGALAALLLALGNVQASEALFQQNCASCHGMHAEGILGLAPPLKHEALWQGLGENAKPYITGVMASGLSGQLSAMGQMYFGLVMPPQTVQKPEDLAAIASYVLHLNGLNTHVSAADVLAARNLAAPHSELRVLRPKNL